MDVDPLDGAEMSAIGREVEAATIAVSSPTAATPPVATPPVVSNSDHQTHIEMQDLKSDPLEQTQIRSAKQAVDFLLHNPENERRTAAAVEEQESRLRAYDSEGPTLKSFIPPVISDFASTTANAVANVIPAPLSNAANAAGERVQLVANRAADVINNAPDLVINTIPDALMSKETKQLVFIDFNNTLRSFFHTNILAMPYVFNETGVIMGVIIVTFTALSCEYATETFLHGKYALEDPSKVTVYGDVPRLTLGDWYPTFNIFYGAIHLIGFQVFAAKNCQVMLRSVFGVTDSNLGYTLGMVLPSVIAFPLILMKSAHSQRPLSISSNFLIGLSCAVLMFYFPYDAFDVDIVSETADRLPIALGVVVYAFTGIGSVVPVERTIPGKKYVKLLRVAVVMSFLLLVLFGLSGYVSYGENTCAVITLSLQDGSTKTAVSVMLFLASIAIIPQQVFPFAEVIDRRLLGLKALPTYLQGDANLARVGAVVGCAFVAYFLPFYGLLSAISGGIGCSVLGFIVPGLIDRNRRMRRRPALRWWEHVVVYSLIGFGVFVMIIGTSLSVYEMVFKLQNSSAECH